jgi:uncharacterized membrane protein
MNFPSGALIVPIRRHAMFGGLSFARPPVVCGINRTMTKPSGVVLLRAQPLHAAIDAKGSTASIRLKSVGYPLLVISKDPQRRIAAFTADVAPHWCGGLVDWGARRLSLPAAASERVEAGDQYVRFLSSLIRWLARAN